MRFRPEYPGEFPTLGHEVLAWMTSMLAQPDREEYHPFLPTREQAEFILRFYELHPVTGKRVVRCGVISRPKGWGKSPFLSAIAIAEGLAPVVFDGWDSSGRPVGKPWSRVRTPIVQLLAVSEGQTRNAWIPLLEMIRQGPIWDAYPGIDPMETMVTLPSGRIEFRTSSAQSAEGNKPVFAVLDQALALDTPIPTPSGWTTMGALKTGDVVYGSNGPVRISEAKPASTEHDCYRVHFSDGTSVVASGGHLWASRRVSWPKKYDRVRTTEEMLDGYRYSIPAAPIQDRPDADLTVSPYLLGSWLGDGTRGKCEIAVAEDDLPALQTVLAADGVETHPRRYARVDGEIPAVNLSFSARAGYQGADRPEVAKRFAALPCYRDKHVPHEFLGGSAAQRLALLQGLMDSDGHVRQDGWCSFVNTNRDLAEAVVVLARSLGQVTSGVTVVEDSRYTGGVKFIVGFSPRLGVVPFRLPRKAARVRSSKRDWVTITSVEKVERVPVRCIAVDSKDHLFSFGESGFLTHNTESWTPRNGGTKLAAAVRRNAGKIGGTTIEAPNAFEPGADSVAEKTAQYFTEIKSGNAKESGLLYDHREGPETTDFEDRESIIDGLTLAYGDSASLPGGCRIHQPPCDGKVFPSGWVDLERIQQEIWDPGTTVSDAVRYYLNRAHAEADAFMTEFQWAAALAPEGTPEVTSDDPIVLGFDGSRHRKKGVTDATALVAMRVSDGLAFPVGIWEQPDTAEGRDWEPPEMEIEQTLDEFEKTHHVVGFYADPSLWESNVAAWEAKFGPRLKVGLKNHPIAWRTSQVRRTVGAVEALQNGILDGQVIHTGSAALTRHVLNARMRQTRSGLLMYKEFPDSARKIDAAYALMLANQARLDALAHGDLEKEKKRRRTAPRKIR